MQDKLVFWSFPLVVSNPPLSLPAYLEALVQRWWLKLPDNDPNTGALLYVTGEQSAAGSGQAIRWAPRTHGTWGHSNPQSVPASEEPRSEEMETQSTLTTPLKAGPAHGFGLWMIYLHFRRSAVLCKSQKNADARLQMLPRANPTNITMKAAKSKRMARSGHHIASRFQPIKIETS